MNHTTDKKPNRLRSLFSKSAIFALLFSLADYLYGLAAHSFIGLLLTGRGETDPGPRPHFFARLAEKIAFRKRVSVPFKRRISREIGSSVLLRILRRYISSLPGIRIRTFGIFGCSFGLYTVTADLIRRFATTEKPEDFYRLFLGASLIVIMIPLILSVKTVSETVFESRLLSFLLFRFAGVRQEYLTAQTTRHGSSIAAFLLGLLGGAATVWVDPLLILLAVPALCVAYAILLQPEIGVVALFFLLPFLPTMVLAGLLILTVLCYLLKLAQGKRILTLKALDLAVLLFLVLELMGGFISVNPAASLKPALLYTCLILGYFLTVNLIRTPEWCNRCIGSAVLSCAIVAAIGIFENYAGTTALGWIDTSMFAGIGTRVVSTFENPNVLAEYLQLLLPLMAGLLLGLKHPLQRLAVFFMAVMTGLCLIFTWSRGAWLGFLVALVCFLLIYSRKTLAALLLGTCYLPFLPLVLPASVTARFTSIGNLRDTSTAYRVNIWKGVLNMLSDHFVTGIGVGEGAFSQIYIQYSLAGIESAPHSHNLFLQITVELGITGLLAFLAVVFFLLRDNLSFFRYKTQAPRGLHWIVAGGFCGLLGFLLQGMTDYIWYNYRVFCMFWLVMGLVTALKRAYLAEEVRHEPDGPWLELPLQSIPTRRNTSL